MSASVRIVTYNIRCCYDTFDGINGFVHRAGLVFDKIENEKPDVVCFQEVMPSHVSLLKRSLKDYTVIYNGRKENFGDEGLCIMIRDCVELLSHDFFWLSPTPKVPASRFTEDQSGCPRIAAATLLRKNGVPFFVYNAHLDHIGINARKDSAVLLLSRVKADRENYKLPVFIMGDFNDVPESECIKVFNTFPFPKLEDLTSNIKTTFHAFGQRKDDFKIDYIFTDAETAKSCSKGRTWEDNVNGIYLSDHYPVSIDWSIE